MCFALENWHTQMLDYLLTCYCATDFNCNTDLVLLMKVYPTVAEHGVQLKYVATE